MNCAESKIMWPTSSCGLIIQSRVKLAGKEFLFHKDVFLVKKCPCKYIFPVDRIVYYFYKEMFKVERCSINHFSLFR